MDIRVISCPIEEHFGIPIRVEVPMRSDNIGYGMYIHVRVKFGEACERAREGSVELRIGEWWLARYKVGLRTLRE